MNELNLMRTIEALFPRVDGERNATEEKDMEVEMEIPRINEEELEVVAKRMMKKGRPAVGPDGITNVTLKTMIKAAHLEVMDLMDEYLRLGLVPKTWKEARLVLIKKIGKPECDPSAYRPLCVLNETGKFLERIIAKRIEEYVERIGPEMSTNQYGFVKNRSTIDALMKIRKIVEGNTETGRFCLACSLNVKNAFNSLTWKSIHEMMRKREFPWYLRKIMRSYLDERKLVWIDREGKEEKARGRMWSTQGIHLRTNAVGTRIRGGDGSRNDGGR